MNELLKVTEIKIEDSFIKTISARDLHTELGLAKSQFSRWIKTNLLENSFFTENIDFTKTRHYVESANNMMKEFEDYQLTIDTAKHLAMLSKTETAHRIRNYFIEIEKKYSIQPEKPNLDFILETSEKMVKLANIFGFSGNQAYLSADKGVKNITGFSPLKILDSTHLQSEKKTKIFTPTQLGKEVGKSPNQINLLLADIGFQKRIGKIWEVLEKGLEFSELLDTNKKHSDGTPVKQIKWQKIVLDKIKIEESENSLLELE